MQAQIDKIRQELQFISRTVSNGYVDFDTLDELAQSAAAALRSLAEIERNQPTLNVQASIHQITVYEPAA